MYTVHVYQKIFVVKNFSWLPQTTKHLHTKLILQRIISTVSTFLHVHVHMQFFTQSAATRLFHEMDLLRYLQPRDGLPDPRGALSLSVPSSAIAEANRKVQEATSKTKKWGPYKRYSAIVRAEIGKHVVATNVASSFVLTCTCQRRSHA